MKTLYININNEQIQSNNELEVIPHDLEKDFLFYLGDKIAKGCNVKNEVALITDFNTQENAGDYQSIIVQWNELKPILFSEECKGTFKFALPKEYIHWLKFHPQYVSIYDKNFSHGESNVIFINLEELYEESVEEMQCEIFRKLKRDDLHEEIDEIVFNDGVVSRNSPNVCIITEKYKNIKFKSYKKYKLKESCTFNDDVLKNKEQNNENLNVHKIVEKHKELIQMFLSGMETIGTFREGLATVQLNGKYGYIDKTGKIIAPIIYDMLFKFREGLAAVQLNGKYGFIDKTGKMVIPCIYDNVFSFYEGLAMVQLNGKYGFIDKTGKMVIPSPIADFNVSGFAEGLVAVKLNDKYGYIDKTGKMVIPCIYDKTYHFCEGLAMVQLNGKYGFIDKTGELVIPCIYDYACYFDEGLAMVQLNGKYGYIDKTGELVIPCIYGYVKSFINGFSKVELNGKYGLIDNLGNTIVPYFVIHPADIFIINKVNLIIVKASNNYLCYDFNGNLLINIKL